jgi:hypothetical protein
MPAGQPRVQFVISGRFIVLLLLAGGFLAGGFWLYTHQPPPPKPQTPPYYVNRTSTAIRPCIQCGGADGKLKERAEWKFGKTIEIPAGETWWFVPVDDPPQPMRIDGIPMLAVHPAINNEKPWFGFDQRRVFLVVFQDLDGRFSIEHPPPPPPPPAPVAPPTDATPPEGSPPTTTQPQVEK